MCAGLRYPVNTARGKLCDRDSIVRALGSGQLASYAGDVWFPQPVPPPSPSLARGPQLGRRAIEAG